MSYVNLAARFFALGWFVAADVVWWRNALMGPPTQRRTRLGVAVLGLLLVLITVWDIVFFH